MPDDLPPGRSRHLSDQRAEDTRATYLERTNRTASIEHPGNSPIAAPERGPEAPALAALRYLRTIRRTELRQIVPLSDTTIYEMEQRGEFPRRFNLTPRCVVWDLAEVQAWIEARKRSTGENSSRPALGPDVRQRRTRPVRR